MQSLTLYGRMMVRAVLSEVAGDIPALTWHRSVSSRTSIRRSLRLVTATAGLSKVHSVNTVGVARAVASAPMHHGSVTPPTIEERTFGDDAFFVARHRLGDVLGVADGVGGWRTYGVDPSLFSTSLMTICERMVREGRFNPSKPVELLSTGLAEVQLTKASILVICERMVREGRFNPSKPVELLSTGLAEVQLTKASILGSCTACVVALCHDEDTLYTANLGDSGFLVVRNGTVIHRSAEQQHYFNTPYQLAVAPPSLRGMVLSDSPESAQESTFHVEEGDLILLGTDGLFDNLTDTQILKHLELLKDNSEESIRRVAISLVSEAHRLGFDPEYLSPFSKNAAANGYDFVGGKPDDVTVILARVTTMPFDSLHTDATNDS